MFTFPIAHFGGALDYTIDQSIRFDRATSSALYRTQGTPDGTSWTLSFWIKRGQLRNGSGEEWFINGGAAYPDYIRFESDDQIRFRIFSRSIDNTTTAYFRDPGAWYHFVANWNGSTGAYNLWQNNVSLISGTGSSGETYYNKSGQLFNIGRDGGGSNYFDGYFAEIVKLDNTVADPTSFAKYNDDGVWVPIDVSGLTFGSEGFYIKGQDSSNLGDDSSGNTNDFTSSGLSSDDAVLDSPTDNFCTMSSVNSYSGLTLADGNLKVSAGAQALNKVNGTFWVDADQGGAWYFEYTVGSNNDQLPGWTGSERTDKYPGQSTDSYSYAWARNGGAAYNPAGSTSAHTGSGTYASGDVLGWLIDFDNDEVKVGKVSSGTWSATITWTDLGTYKDGGPAGGAWTATDRPYNGNGTFNFGQTGGFAASNAPGQALKTSNLSDPTIADSSLHFNTALYTGDGSSSTRSITGVGFQPDFVWKKKRSGADHHWLHDAVRGATKGLNSNRTDSEYTSNRLTSFDSDGFSFATSDPDTNGSGETYVAWAWKAGNGTAANTDGSITSTVSANTTAGISVVTYTGTGSAATVGHGLGAEPQFIAIKGRTNVDSWGVYPGTSMGYGGQYRLKLNETSSVAASSVYWNNTDATSSVFTVNTDAQVNGSGVDYVAYCFAEVEGFSKFGNYEGNGSSDGSFVYTGFRPSFLLVKNVDAAESWNLRDSVRDPINVTKEILFPNTNGAEATSGGGQFADLLSNGFKLRGTDPGVNSSATFIYIAFAESPFKTATAR